MAFTPNSNLTLTPPTIMRDYQHAALLFNSDQFRLAPKHGFLFHVAFGINKNALTNASLVQRYGHEINMLVKSIDLPSYSISTETVNQYNRKKVVQYQQKPGEIGIKFHDDNMGLINQLWQNYYSYYYADSTTAKIPGAFARNATKGYSTIPANYGFDAGSSEPFFSYIKIYQMARHEYVLYQLYNPIITSWNHNKVSYSDQGVHEVDMKVIFEAVSYGVGAVSSGDPEGFGQEHYDTTPSPLQGKTPPGTINPSFVSSIDTTGLNAGILSHAISQVNNYQNTQQSSSPLQSVGGALGAAAGLAAAAGIAGAALGAAKSIIGGLSGISFPTFGSKDVQAPEEDEGPSGTEDGGDDSGNDSGGDDPTSEEDPNYSEEESLDSEEEATPISDGEEDPGGWDF